MAIVKIISWKFSTNWQPPIVWYDQAVAKHLEPLKLTNKLERRFGSRELFRPPANLGCDYALENEGLATVFIGEPEVAPIDTSSRLPLVGVPEGLSCHAGINCNTVGAVNRSR